MHLDGNANECTTCASSDSLHSTVSTDSLLKAAVGVRVFAAAMAVTRATSLRRRVPEVAAPGGRDDHAVHAATSEHDGTPPPGPTPDAGTDAVTGGSRFGERVDLAVDADSTGDHGPAHPLLAMLSVSVPLLTYLITTAPDMTLVDSGELCLAAHGPGVAHPAGFPAWV